MAVSEVGRRNETRHNRSIKARLVVAPIVASLTLAACSGNSKGSSPTTPSAPQTTAVSNLTTTTTESTPSSSPSTTSGSSEASGLASCAPYFDVVKYRNHEYEVCVAYVNNAANIALRGLYMYGNNSAGYVANLARHHFETRYWEQPRNGIEQQVTAWPKTKSLAGNDVDASIKVTELSSSLSADRGLLETVESWQVTAPNGVVLYNQSSHTQDITMCRGKLPGHPLHEWMVVSLSQQPDFDCLSFDKSNDITP